MASDQLERIFLPLCRQRGVPLYRRDGFRPRISHQLVQLMRGDLRVKSELGRGSLFWFELTLPIAEMVEEIMAPPSRIITGYQAAGAGAGGRRYFFEPRRHRGYVEAIGF